MDQHLLNPCHWALGVSLIWSRVSLILYCLLRVTYHCQLGFSAGGTNIDVMVKNVQPMELTRKPELQTLLTTYLPMPMAELGEGYWLTGS